MDMAGSRGTSRRKERVGRWKKEKRFIHFKTVRSGGFDENQIICYLWDIVKSVEEVRNTGEAQRIQELAALAMKIRRQIRVEIRRYFLRQKRRNVRIILMILILFFCVVGVFGFLIGVDRVSGNSMYPYLNDGDWILYGRIGGELRRDQVVVFDRNGESFVKRIAGLPGDTVEISASGSRVVVNGTQVSENFVTLTKEKTEGGVEKYGNQMGMSLTVMDSQYLVLGDNRSISIDSRNEDMGTVPEEDILGRVLLIVRTGR